MNDVADVGNERAAAILDAQRRGHDESITNHYLIAHCSGDGELVIMSLPGNSKDRFAYMESVGADPVVTKNWAFTQWSYETCFAGSWGKIHAGNGEIEQQLREYIAAHKPRPR